MAFSSWNLATTRGDGSTTDGTALNLVTIALPTAGNMVVQAFVIARDSSNNSKGWNLNASTKSVGGVASLLGSLVALLTGGDVSASTWSATISVSGGNAIVQVTGAVATSITWSAYVTSYTAS